MRRQGRRLAGSRCDSKETRRPEHADRWRDLQDNPDQNQVLCVRCHFRKSQIKEAQLLLRLDKSPPAGAAGLRLAALSYLRLGRLNIPTTQWSTLVASLERARVPT